jgi:hypothetical protein
MAGPIEELMTIATEYYAARRQTERELETKIIENSPTSYPVSVEKICAITAADHFMP